MDMATIALEGEKGFLEEIRKTVTFQIHKHTNGDLQTQNQVLYKERSVLKSSYESISTLTTHIDKFFNLCRCQCIKEEKSELHSLPCLIRSDVNTSFSHVSLSVILTAGQ